MSAAARASVLANGRSGSTNSDTINRLPDVRLRLYLPSLNILILISCIEILTSHAQHGRPNGHCMELMGFGDAPARELILRMVVCDGDTSRAQRRVLLDPKWVFVGVGFGDHTGSFKKMISIALSTNYEEN